MPMLVQPTETIAGLPTELVNIKAAKAAKEAVTALEQKIIELEVRLKPIESSADNGVELVWDKSSPRDLGSFEEAMAVTIPIQANTAKAGATVTYTTIGNNLPSGVSFTDNGDGSATVSGTLLNYATPQSFTFMVEAYDGFETITRPFTLLVNAVDSEPVWVTKADLGLWIASDVTVGLPLLANDPEATPVAYALSDSTLPSTMTLSTAGLLDGTLPVSGDVVFTVTASDGVSTVPRSFIMGRLPPEYPDSVGSKRVVVSGPSLNAGLSGYFGELPATQFITGDALSTLTGVTTGSSVFNNTPWLKFAYEGKTLYLAKQNIRYNLSYNHLLAANVVDGSQTVVIGGATYRVRLLSEADGEWVHMVLPLTVAAEIDNDWGYDFTQEDLGIKGPVVEALMYKSNAIRSWVTPTAGGGSLRGSGNMGGMKYLSDYPNADVSYVVNGYTTWNGWRPVLELVL